MNSLVDIVVFGIAGAVVLAAVVGLLLVAGRSLPKGALGAVCVALLLAVPAMAASRTLSGGVGAGGAFLVASAAVVIVYAAGVALLPIVTRQAAAGRGVAVPSGLRITPATAGGGLLVCAVLGAAGTGIALLIG
ncbi:hypothetical protein LP52_22370 [Streptomonospora alba]|uniref:Uncharacterized protein n=1 Tax=Streptomonospora alba TaxID=183763 RepID=A0A0C2JD70_9ACTN|nr:hypothetical protein [Streptomonospora alba]KIH96895.1 hypothetical protein LP52_22370 [Streptomonospora alba]